MKKNRPTKEDKYWTIYVQSKLQQLERFGDNKKSVLVDMLQAGPGQGLLALDFYSEPDSSLNYAAKLMAAWQQIIKEVTARDKVPSEPDTGAELSASRAKHVGVKQRGGAATWLVACLGLVLFLAATACVLAYCWVW